MKFSVNDFLVNVIKYALFTVKSLSFYFISSSSNVQFIYETDPKTIKICGKTILSRLSISSKIKLEEATLS